jgi:hypothetical protein
VMNKTAGDSTHSSRSSTDLSGANQRVCADRRARKHMKAHQSKCMRDTIELQLEAISLSARKQQISVVLPWCT